jgi:hypothetical protein
VGQACGNGAVCEATAGCASDTSTCGPLPGDGGACALGSEGPFLCEAGLACLDGTCGPMPGLGDPCAIPNRCGPDLACDFTPNGSICSLRRGADAGCQNDVICADGLFCDYSQSQCAPFRPTGAACSAGNECGPGSTCMPDATGSFVCTLLPALGATCFFDCAPGSWCESTPLPGVCHAELCPLLVGG